MNNVTNFGNINFFKMHILPIGVRFHCLSTSVIIVLKFGLGISGRFTENVIPRTLKVSVPHFKLACGHIFLVFPLLNQSILFEFFLYLLLSQSMCKIFRGHLALIGESFQNQLGIVLCHLQTT